MKTIRDSDIVDIYDMVKDEKDKQTRVVVKKNKTKEKFKCQTDQQNMILCQISGHEVIKLIQEIAKEYPLFGDVVKVRYIVEGRSKPTFRKSPDPTNALVDDNGPIIYEFKKNEWDKDIKHTYFKLCNTCRTWTVCRDNNK